MSETQPADLPTAPTKIQLYFPIAAWLPKYDFKSFLTADLIAAISVAALLIPESMGYASVAGVPVQIGLYATPLALIGYAMFGGSRLLVFGVAGSVAAVSAGIVGGMSGGDQSTAIAMTAALALTTGAVFVVSGLVGLGWITNFMSKAIMAGFITGMSWQIIIGQLGKVVGADVAGDNSVEKLWSVVSQIGSWDWATVAFGVGALVSILVLSRFLPKLPAALIAVVVASALIAFVGFDIDLVAEIPKGLPSFGLPTGIDSSTWLNLLAGGAMVALVGFSEGWGASKTIAKTTHDQLNADQEFRASGVANIGAGLLGGMVTCGGLSKSSAAESAGAKTQMSNIFLAAVTLLVLAFLGPAFQWLPEAVLGAIVIHAMLGSANPKKLEKLWRVNKVDFALALVTFALVLALDLLPALAVGVALSILYMVYRVSFPAREVLGRIPETGDFVVKSWLYGRRHGKAHAEAQPVPGVIVYRFSAPLIFSNADAFKNGGQALLIEAAKTGPLPHTLVIDFEEVFLVDDTGASELVGLFSYAQRYGVDLALARVHSATHQLLKLAGTAEEIGEDRFFDTVRNAVNTSVEKHGALDTNAGDPAAESAGGDKEAKK